MPPQHATRYLLVEGNSDLQLIRNLCARHGLPELAVEMPKRGGGITQLLESVPERINAPDLEALGIVMDADIDISARWQALRDRLQDREKLQDLVYRSFPAAPDAEGWVSSDAHSPRVGVWLMPDNLRSGMLEDFAVNLIPANDPLLAKADAVLHELEGEQLNRYTASERPKALIHTWLAWQREPGRPLGQAMAHQLLLHDAPLARAFVAWLRRLFALPPAPGVA